MKQITPSLGMEAAGCRCGDTTIPDSTDAARHRTLRPVAINHQGIPSLRAVGYGWQAGFGFGLSAPHPYAAAENPPTRRVLILHTTTLQPGGYLSIQPYSIEAI